MVSNGFWMQAFEPELGGLVMLRCALAAGFLLGAGLPVRAEDVWMVKSSGVLGCDDRETLVALDGADQLQGHPPGGCVELHSGERLLERADVGAGFHDYMNVQRSDGSTVFVRGSALVADPGIGSVTDDRPE